MLKPVAVTLEIPGAKPGEIGQEVVARFDTIAEAEDYLATSAAIDPDRLEAGDYGIDAPEEMINPPKARLEGVAEEDVKMDRQFNVVLSYDTYAESPEEAVQVALAAIATGGGSVFVEIYSEQSPDTTEAEGFMPDFVEKEEV